jgi:hypothetical protein
MDSIPDPRPQPPHTDDEARRGSTDPATDATETDTPPAGDTPTDDPAEAPAQPPLPDEEAPAAPPLPDEAPPPADDGWEPVWDPRANAFYFYNKITGKSQWENPRVPEAASAAPGAPGSSLAVAPGLGTHDRTANDDDDREERRPKVAGGYNPAVHGDYDPTADYARADASDEERDPSSALAAPGTSAVAAAGAGAGADGGQYAATGAFNRFTGRWQNAALGPEHYSDESKSNRQMSAFFDVESSAAGHDGRSLRAERQNKKLSKKEVRAFKEKRREKKEEKRRAWLRD